MSKSLEDYSAEELAQMAKTYHDILNHPETRGIALQMTKKINPNVSIPELDIRAQASAAFAQRDEKIRSLEDQIRERDARDRISQERATLRDQGFSHDDVSAIEKIMTEKQIPSYQTAAEYYKGQQTLATPAPHVSGRATTFSMPTDALGAMKGGKAGLNKWARESAAAALDDLRSGRIKLQ